MKYGYVRVSSTTQNIARQVEEMKKYNQQMKEKHGFNVVTFIKG